MNSCMQKCTLDLPKPKPWNESKVVVNKTVWARCRGLPLSLWTVDCFRKVLHKVGTLVDVDETILNWERVEYSRLMVRKQ